MLSESNDFFVSLKNILGLGVLVDIHDDLYLLVWQVLLISLCITSALIFSLVLNVSLRGVLYMRNCLIMQMVVFSLSIFISLKQPSISSYLSSVILSFVAVPLWLYPRQVLRFLSK